MQVILDNKSLSKILFKACYSKVIFQDFSRKKTFLILKSTLIGW